MRAFVRFALGAVAALALCATAAAGVLHPADLHEGGPPPASSEHATAVVIRIGGGFHASNRWLWFAGDDTAEYQGLFGEPGRFHARIDFARVDKVVADARLCTRTVAAGHPAGSDMFVYHVSLRCGDRWRYLTEYAAAIEPEHDEIRGAILELEHLAWNATWSHTDDRSQLPDNPPLFHTAQLSP